MNINTRSKNYSEIKLHFDNQMYIRSKHFEILVEWIYDIWKIGKTNDDKQLITACFHVVNIMNKRNNILTKHYQLIGIIAMHCADFKYKWGNIHTPISWSYMCLQLYTPEYINKECNKWYTYLKLYDYNFIDKVPFGVGHVYDKATNMNVLYKQSTYDTQMTNQMVLKSKL